MASKRLLKKRAKRIVYEVLDSGDYYIVNNLPSADKADKLMDEAVEFHEATIAGINAAASKKEFSEIAGKVEKASVDFTKKLNGLD